MQTKPTQTQLREYLSYDENTGELVWIKKPSKKTVLNSRAGSLVTTTGYRSIHIFGKSYPEHHIIWCWYYGYYPTKQIDHIDQIRDNNRIKNLREVTQAVNSRNRSRRRNTRVEEAGIWFNRRTRRYVAEITLNQKKVYQRSFENVEDAITSRKAKLIELGFHENHGS